MAHNSTRDVLPLLHIHVVGQGPTVYIYIYIYFFFFFFFFHLSSISNVLSFERRLNTSEISAVVVSYCRGRPRLVLFNRLEGLNLPRKSTTINWPALHDLVVDWAVRPQHKQTNTTPLNFEGIISCTHKRKVFLLTYICVMTLYCPVVFFTI